MLASFWHPGVLGQLALQSQRLLVYSQRKWPLSRWPRSSMKWFACEKSTSKSVQSTLQFLHVSPVVWVLWSHSTYPLVRVAAGTTADLILIHHVVAEELKGNDGHVMHPTRPDNAHLLFLWYHRSQRRMRSRRSARHWTLVCMKRPSGSGNLGRAGASVPLSHPQQSLFH